MFVTILCKTHECNRGAGVRVGGLLCGAAGDLEDDVRGDAEQQSRHQFWNKFQQARNRIYNMMLNREVPAMMLSREVPAMLFSRNYCHDSYLRTLEK